MTKRERKELLQAIGLMTIMATFMLAVILIAQARAHDSGQWQAIDPEIKRWYETLMMPDIPQASCCGEADSYWADDVFVREGKTYARITDDRDDVLLRRSRRDRSIEHLIPDYKIKKGSNPTGHNVIFLSNGDAVYCFIFGAGA